MKKILIMCIVLSIAWGQSVGASLTIYKDGFGLVKQPVSWNLEAGLGSIRFDRLPSGMYADSPFLHLENAEIHTQRLDSNIFSSNKLFNDKLGQTVKLKVNGDKPYEGILLEFTSSQITIQDKSEVQTFSRNKVDYISLKGKVANPRFRSVLSWDIFANNAGKTDGSLVYMSGGFDWNANYRMIMEADTLYATLIPEAYIKNNSDITFTSLDLQLVEGNLNRVRHEQVGRMEKRNFTAMAMESDMAYGAAPVPERENLGDYYIYSIPNKLKFKGNESVTVRLYDSRKISFDKTYLFDNWEQSQREEPLVVEIKIANNEENNLDIPLPAGKIELYQKMKTGQLEFMGEDRLKQIPKGATAKLTAGRAFDVVGKRKVLNYDRQRKSEEASIQVKITNTKDTVVKVKVIERISGDWVVKDESSMYIKDNASTIHFPLTIPANSEKYVTYTYRKEWK